MKTIRVQMYFGTHGQIHQESFLRENRNVFFLVTALMTDNFLPSMEKYNVYHWE